MNAKTISVYTKTIGARIRHARQSCEMTQENFANGVALVTKTKCNKSLVSKWESDSAVPVASTLSAIASVTGFALQWLATAEGPERGKLAKLRIEDRNDKARESMRRAVRIAQREQKDPDRVADAIIECFYMIADEPDIPDTALKRIAQLAH